MTMRVAALVVVLAALAAGPAAAAPTPAERAQIEQAYAREADAHAAIEQRIAAQWPALNDPAAPFVGSPNGDAVIVEFFDYNCPYCKAVEPRLEALLRTDHRVKLVLKEFPILTPASMVATRAALASIRQGKYAPFHQAMMQFEGNITEADIFAVAHRVGLDVARLKRDMQTPEIADRIIANFNQARAIRAFQTPAFIAGGAAGTHLLSSTSASIDFPHDVAVARGH